MRRPLRTLVVLTSVLLIAPGSKASAQPVPTQSPSTATCDADGLERLKAQFLDLAAARAADATSVSDDAVRQASLEYLSQADACYRALSDSPSSTQRIDDDGVWFSPDGSQPYVTFGTKWGAGSPFTGATYGSGPMMAGGTVTYSYMGTGVSIAAEGVGSSLSLASLPTFDPCFTTAINNAFAVWSAAANIQFVEVVDNGVAFNAAGAGGDIRIGAHTFDGPSNVLAHGYYPPPNGLSASGDIHFDRDEPWSCRPGTGVFDIGVVALHEIGHAIGLQHEFVNVAVMNPFYNATLSRLRPDDVTGVVVIYGPAPVSSVPNPRFSAVLPVGIRAVARRGDFDGDRKADVSMYRPSTGAWYLWNSAGTHVKYDWGLEGDIPAPGDYDGDGKFDLAVYRPRTGTWYVSWSSLNFTLYSFVPWGLYNDVPVPADYDGDGRTDFAVYRPSTSSWWVLPSSPSSRPWFGFAWTNGEFEDVPVPADYDGDGITDMAIYRPGSGDWWVVQPSRSPGTPVSYSWGVRGDQPVVADYDGDGKADPAIYRPSTGAWWILKSSADYRWYMTYSWGLPGDVPVPADYDGDGKADPAIYRSSTSGWWVLQTTNGAAANTVLGAAGDVPLFLRR